VQELIEYGTLVPGDWLYDAMVAMLDAAVVRFVFLPSYSPELSPIELVFSEVKSRLRRDRVDQSSFADQIVASFARVQHESVVRYYYKCLSHSFE